MMTKVSLEMAMKASSWTLVLHSSTTTAQDKAPRREASGEKRGRIDSFFFGANRAAINKFINECLLIRHKTKSCWEDEQIR